MSRPRRRHSTGFGYIGFGNNHGTFNRHSKAPFSVVKENLNYEAELHYKLDFTHHELTNLEREAIKLKIRKEARSENIKAVCISTVLYALILFGAYKLIERIMSY